MTRSNSRDRSRSRDRNDRNDRQQSAEDETEEDLKRKLFIGNLGYSVSYYYNLN